ncbi:glycoside hydrolase family 43 protein [Marseilla massiliensis]|uniref:Glycoside hydrolase family 43 protein n=1 Tax=Marseilla massiliensis TaxID=1841864 RepID=A0A939B762_9BACT|nr:glycoside hydrolase family 43 protein [Marseilla massiliensis]MBM6673212.1 glycoside hydrolase family 43 protein [Marseilla massiliensis]
MKKARYLFPSDYMADPSANVFNGKLYIYPSHDWDSGAAFDDDGGHFEMKDYHVLSLDDVEDGEVTDHGVILALEDIPWAGRQLWDNDVVEKDGKYYLIFSAKDKNDVFHLGVAVSDRPEGPFKAQPDPIRGSYSIDPCVFKDDDGSVYTYFGGLWGGQLQRYKENKAMGKEYLPEGDENALPSRVAKMTDDMLQFAEEPRPVLVIDENGKPLRADDPHRFFEASWMHKVNGKYYFSYSTGDSHLLCYAVGDNPYGPFTYKGVILEPVVGWTTHHSIVEYKGKWYLFHHDCVPSNGVTWLRSVKVMELDMDSDGNIKTMRSE